MDSSAREDILFATIQAGGGHVATARAMQAAVEAAGPGRWRTRLSDHMADLGLERQDRQHKQLWKWLLARPQLIRSGQRFMDALPAATRRWHQLTLAEFARRASRDLNEAGTRLVVANHGWLATGLTLAQARYGLRSRVLVFATEPFDASALWAEPAAQLVVAPSEAARRSLLRLGLPADRIRVVGYPVSPAFLRPAAQPPLTSGLRITVSLGGEGTGADPVPLIRSLLEAGHHTEVLTGRNSALLAGLERLQDGSGRLVLHGFTDRVADIIAGSHLTVGKAGPASVMESLALGRPFLATGYAGLNELAVIRFLEQRGLGRLVSSTGQLLEAADAYRRQPELLAQATADCRQLDFPGMAERLARAITGFLEDGAVPPDATGRGLDGGSSG